MSYHRLLATFVLFITASSAWSAWQPMMHGDVAGPIALSSQADNTLHLVAVSHSGRVETRVMDRQGNWSHWWVLGEGSRRHRNGEIDLYADTETAPVLLRHGDWMILLVRGADDHLYAMRSALVPISDIYQWGDLQRLTPEAVVKGRITASVTTTTDATGQTNTHLHVLAMGAEDTAIYGRFRWDNAVRGWQADSAPGFWFGVKDASIGADSRGQVFVATITTGGQLHLDRQRKPWNTSWKRIAELKSAGGGVYDVSNLVEYAGDMHLLYSWSYRPDDVSTRLSHHLYHARTNDQNDVELLDVTEYNPFVRGVETMVHPRSTLAVYRNKLVGAYTDPYGMLHYARLDDASEVPSWAGNLVIGPEVTSRNRPALAAHDFWRVDMNFAADVPGNDLFAAVVDKSSSQVQFSNFSRDLFIAELPDNYTFYQSNSQSNSTSVCRSQSDADAPTLIGDLSSDSRPFYTEFGFAQWVFPRWLIEGRMREGAQRGCLAGTNNSGRYDPPCEDARYPVIIFENGGPAHRCSGIWLSARDPHADRVSRDVNGVLRGSLGNTTHEMLHVLASELGIHDPHNGVTELPTQIEADRYGIDLVDLLDGQQYFSDDVNPDCFPNEATDTCPNGRTTGFTGGGNGRIFGGNYDASSNQHSFIGSVMGYFSNGVQLRQWVQDDLSVGDTVLRDKYDWIHDHLFGGKEYGLDQLPYLPPFDSPDADLVYAYSAARYPRGGETARQLRPLGLGDVVEGGDWFSLEISLPEFSEPVDVHVHIYAPDLTPGVYQVVRPDGTLQPSTAGLVPWRSAVSAPIDESLLGDLNQIIFPRGTYMFRVSVMVSGDPGRQYTWQTEFNLK